MGEFVFVYPKHRVSTVFAKRAFIAGRGRRPLNSIANVSSLESSRNLLTVTTLEPESGSLYVPYVDKKGDFFFASTDPLPQTAAPKSLFLELCRGQLSRMQRKRFEWSYVGWETPKRLRAALRREVATFAKLATSDRDAPNFDADCEALFLAMRQTSRALNELYLEKALNARRNATTRWTTNLGFAASIKEDWSRAYDEIFASRTLLVRRPRFSSIFQTFNPRFNWNEIERVGNRYDWTPLRAALQRANDRGLRATVGPLLRWDSDIPLQFCKETTTEDFSNEFQRYVVSAVDAAGSTATRWIIAANVESESSGLPFDFRLQLARQTAYWIKERQPRAQVFLGFEQAFGDAARFGRVSCMTGLELATRILRQDFRIDGFYLEANFGLSPGATAPRDPMELHRFFDRWSCFGAPLSIAVSCPSAAPSVPTLEERNARLPNNPDAIFDPDLKRTLDELCWSEKAQQETANTFISSALARRMVDEILWTRFVDADPIPYAEYSAAFEKATATSRARFEAATEELDSGKIDEEDAEDEIHAFVDEEDEAFDDLDVETSSASISASVEIDEILENRRNDSSAPTSGLVNVKHKAKGALYKLDGIKRAFID